MHRPSAPLPKRNRLAASPLALLAAFASAASCRSQNAEPEKNPSQQAFRADDSSARIRGALVVDFRDGTTKAQYDEWEKAWNIDLEFVSDQDTEDGITVAVGVDDVDAVLSQIRGHPEVEVAEPMYLFQLPPDEAPWMFEGPVPSEEDEQGFTPNDPLYPKQWNLKLIGMPKAWKQTKGKGVVVAVLDTGIAYEDRDEFRQVPDLKGVKFTKGYDFVNKDPHPNDDHGHGTHVAGTIAQATNNKEGVAGVAFEATLMPVKVLNHFGSGNSADIADAIRWAADHGAKVINMSLGGGARSLVMEKAVEYARKKGAVVVAAAGNHGGPPVSYPAAYPGAIAVGAIGPDGKRAPYSAFGKELDIAAPGGNKQLGEESGVLQNTIDGRDPSKSVYAFYQGTSMATPHVSAVAALLYASGANSPDEIEQALFEGAKAAPGQSGWNEQYGHGVLNAEGSLKALGGTDFPGSMADVKFGPLLFALGALALVLLTVRPRQRPGYLNVLVKPTFLLPLVLATVGFFFLRWWFGSASGALGEVVDLSSIPIPDWQRIIFGRGKLANPLFYSALIPIGASLLGIKWKELRPVVAGLAIGFAGFLGYALWAQAPALAYLPFKVLAYPWLFVNAACCLLIARAMLKKEA